MADRKNDNMKCEYANCTCGDEPASCGNHIETDPTNPCDECEKISSAIVEGHTPTQVLTRSAWLTNRRTT